MSQKQIIIDVRTEKEYKESHVTGSINIPLGSIDDSAKTINKLFHDTPVILMCKTWKRSQMAQNKLSAQSKKENFKVYAWGIFKYKEKHPESIEYSTSNALPSIMRQVQIAAGSLVILFILLSLFIHSAFILWALFVWWWLLFAGVSNTCMMANILGKLPFNK